MTYSCIKGESAVDTQIFISSGDETLLAKAEEFNSTDRIVVTTQSHLVLTIRKHDAKDKVITAINFDFKAKYASSIALTAIKHRLNMHDINTDTRINTGNSDVSFAKYVCEAFNQFNSQLLLRESAKAVKSLVPSVISSDEEAVKSLIEWTGAGTEKAEAIYEESHSDMMEEIIKSVTLTADHNTYELHDMEIEAFAQNERNVVVLRSPTGTCKTEFAKALIEREAKKGRKTATITGLIAVVKQHTPSNVASAFYDEQMHVIENASHLSATVNSLTNAFTAETVKEADTIIIDECEKVLQSIFDPRSDYISELAKRTIRAELAQAIRSNKKVIFMDADATDAISVRYAKAFGRKVKTVNMCKNVYRDIATTVESIEVMNQELIAKKLLGKSQMFIACDRKGEIDRLVEQSGYTNAKGKVDYNKALKAGILVVHSENKGGKEQRAFLKNPNQEIDKYRTVIVSPCLKEGFSITANHADEVIVLCNRVLQPTALVQLARRLRTAIRLTFSVPTFSQAAAYTDYRADTIKGNITSELEAEFLVRDELLKSNLRFTLAKTLQLLGFNVERVDVDFEEIKAASKADKVSKEAFEKSERKATTEALNLNNVSIAELREKEELTTDESYTVKKYEIAQRLRISTERVDEDVYEFNKVFKKEFLKVLKGNLLNGGSNSREAKAMKVLADALGVKELSVDTEIVVEDTTAVYNHLVDKQHRSTFNAAGLCELKAGKKRSDTKGKKAASRALKEIMTALGFEEKRNRKGNTTNGKIYTLHKLAKSALFESNAIEEIQAQFVLVDDKRRESERARVEAEVAAEKAAAEKTDNNINNNKKVSEHA
ncbi:hypothetical protein NOK64_19345 [Vibrio parahaemolyticus]|uniref:hypothetical protein n=1 Tax=Vibrio parahaemolyticus TaxID=670 RepID=UPI00226A1E93|nr:hypothetical protein [Vibrio parahaemolyticus]MCX8758007.1 hypothetical protein [Vibrio parahaemolyticus]